MLGMRDFGRFGDGRLQKGGADFLAALVGKSSSCLRRLGGDRAGTERFRRFLHNRRVTLEAMIATTTDHTARAALGRHMLAMQDTTEINFSGHEGSKRGFGVVGNGEDLRSSAPGAGDGGRVGPLRRRPLRGHCRTGGRLRAHASESAAWRAQIARGATQEKRDARSPCARAGAGLMACARPSARWPAPPWSPSSPIARAISMICSPPRVRATSIFSCEPSTIVAWRAEPGFSPRWPLRRPSRYGRAIRRCRRRRLCPSAGPVGLAGRPRRVHGPRAADGERYPFRSSWPGLSRAGPASWRACRSTLLGPSIRPDR